MTRWFLRIFPVVVAASSAAVWFLADSRRAAGLVIGGGIVIWLSVMLSSVGSKIEPGGGGSDG